jgi:uncharacterized membrane protein
VLYANDLAKERQQAAALARRLWPVVLILCLIAAAVAVRRMIALAHPAAAARPMGGLDALFETKADLTRAHLIVGLAVALIIPLQLATRIRARFPWLHRWLGRVFVIAGVVTAVSGYAMVAIPVGGPLEVSAIIFYASAFLVTLLIAWMHIRRGDVVRHREWMLRAVAIVLGIAATRPVVAVFFATSRLTALSPSQFFGVAFWIGFTSTALAGEWYVRRTRRGRLAKAA